MVVPGDNPVVVFRVYVPAHCTYRDIPPRTEINRARRREPPSSVRRCVAFFPHRDQSPDLNPELVGAFFSVFLPLLRICFFLSLTHTLSFLIYLSLFRSLLLYSSFPSPLKVKCIREETSPGRGGSDPPRAAPRETRVRGCSRMLRKRES